MLHYRIPVQDIINLIPPGLKPDTINGYAWVSWVSFTVKNMRPRILPALPYVSDFEEVNLRTYVTHNGRPGIYLLSVEANKFLPVLLTRLITGIPYVTSGIERNHGCIRVVTKDKAPTASLNFSYTDPIAQKAHLDYWLTERHCLFTIQKNSLYCYNIHHKEWNLTDVIASVTRLRYKVNGITIGKRRPDKKHFSKRVKVLLWGKTLLTDKHGSN